MSCLLYRLQQLHTPPTPRPLEIMLPCQTIAHSIAIQVFIPDPLPVYQLRAICGTDLAGALNRLDLGGRLQQGRFLRRIRYHGHCVECSAGKAL